jgi:hypothetical protein
MPLGNALATRVSLAAYNSLRLNHYLFFGKSPAAYSIPPIPLIPPFPIYPNLP